MPTLEITRAGLGPEHAMATRNYLLSVMLWPRERDAAERAEFMRTCAAAEAADKAVAVPAMGAAGLGDLLRQTIEARPPRDFEAEISRREKIGLQIGEYYAVLWQPAALKRVGVMAEPYSVKQLQGAMTSPRRRALHPDVIKSDKTLESVLADFRPAACLWAAQFIRYRESIDHEAPCAPDRILDFLAYAESVRQLVGPALRSLSSDDLWRPPAWLRLRHVVLKPL